MHPYLRLVRAGNLVVSFAGTIVGGLSAAGRGFGLPANGWALLLLAAGSTACVTAGGNVLNDWLDRDSDRVNHPDRPLVTGAVAPGMARWIAGGLFAAAAGLAAPVVLSFPLLAVILATAVAALLAYEFRFKSEGFLGNLVVAFLTGAVFLYGAAAVGAASAALPLAGLAFLATLSREVIKDMEDAEGDTDRRTLPRTRGLGVSAAVARGSVVAAIALSPVPAVTILAGEAVPTFVYLALVAVADAVFVASILWLPGRLHREQSLSKGAMSLALVAFAATAFR